MKFRYKVLISNLWLLSLGLGVVGYLMVQKNFELARENQMQNAISENNLVQAMVEYELLGYLNGSRGGIIEEQLEKIGEMVSGSMLQTTSSFYIKYEDRYVYSSDDGQQQISEALFEELDVGDKNYVISKENENYYIYVTSCSMVDASRLCVICKRDVSEVYEMMETQTVYFRWLTVVIMLAASVLMYGISSYLTRPLEKLNLVTDQIAEGNYGIRVEVKSRDEIGHLAEKFNQMAAAVKNHVEELNEMVHRREQFVADFTHEIKTPMTAIIGYADTMRSMKLPREEEIMSLNYIFSEGRRLEAMSQKLFELIYLNQHEIEMTPIHVEDMGNEIVKIVEPMLKDKAITLSVELEAAKIMGNRELLVSVFINLIDNARKASHHGARILFTGEKVDLGYEMSVRDYGIGMTEEDAEKICDEFYMVDKSRARKEGGAGLGMSLAALILKRHKARMSVESRLNQGTVIRVLFFGNAEEEAR